MTFISPVEGRAMLRRPAAPAESPLCRRACEGRAASGVASVSSTCAGASNAGSGVLQTVMQRMALCRGIRVGCVQTAQRASNQGCGTVPQAESRAESHGSTRVSRPQQ